MAIHELFFFLLILFLPTQLGLHIWPEWAFVLGRRIDYLSPTLFVTDFLLVFTVVAWFLQNPQIVVSRAISALRDRKKLIFMCLLAGFIIINIFVAASKPLALYKWIKVLEFAFLAFYITKTKPNKEYVVLALSVAIFYSSIIAIIQFGLQHSIGGPFWLLGERSFRLDTSGIARASLCVSGFLSDCREWLRAYGTFPHPNVLAGFLTATVPLVLNRMFRPTLYALKIQAGKSIVINFFYNAVACTGIIALILTFSRSSWVIAFLAMSWVWHKRMTASGERHRVWLLMAISVGLLAAVTFMFYYFIPFSDETIGVRQELLRAAVVIWQRSPLVGVGLGNFLVELPRSIPSRTIYFLQPVHNIYLLVLVETGVIGFIFFSLLLVRILAKFSKDDLFQKGIGISLAALLLLGFVDHYLATLQQGQLLFSLYVGLLLSFEKRR